MPQAMREMALEESDELDIQPITPICGAEISGLSLSTTCDARMVAQIDRLLRERKVLVFRDQMNVTPHALESFAAQFGRPEIEPHPDLPDHPETHAVKVIVADGSYGQDTWHTDGATRTQTRWLSFLQAIDVPPNGRDTIFADMEAAFEGLSPKLQEFLKGCSALQSWGISKPEAPPISHPAAVENPVTGRFALYVNHGYTRAIEGVHPDESDLLLQFLMRRVYIPEYHVRVSWRPGTIVVWDNQTTQHYIVQDSRYRRTMHRVMVEPV